MVKRAMDTAPALTNLLGLTVPSSKRSWPGWARSRSEPDSS